MPPKRDPFRDVNLGEEFSLESFHADLNLLVNNVPALGARLLSSLCTRRD